MRIKNPIVIETIPTANEIAPKLNPSIEIINRVDKMSAFGETDQAYIASLEKSQIMRAKRTYYTSQTLLNDESAWHEGRGKFLDHGVDIEKFTPRKKNALSPVELSNIKNPIIGFFGGIDDYVLDLELIERIADQFPYCTLLLIGEATCDISQITKKSNVLFLGFRSVEEVANLGAFFDVAILPRKNDEWSKYTNPIKIKEYLALGIKVVTMDIPEVRRYVPEVFIAHSPDEFIDQIRTALSAPFEDEDRILMSKLVENDTWDQRCEEVVIDMKELLTCAE